jgi:hypothetical protein
MKRPVTDNKMNKILYDIKNLPCYSLENAASRSCPVAVFRVIMDGIKEWNGLLLGPIQLG